MEVKVRCLTSWKEVLNCARTTVGKQDLSKEPSDEFKRKILVSEHSPIRNLLYQVEFKDIPYWVAMHLRTHHIGFHSGEDDLFFIKTQRTDRTNFPRDQLPQNTPVNMKIAVNAHSIINVSRVRLCGAAMPQTIKAWTQFMRKLEEIEPMLSQLCKPNCFYRGFCPEGDNTCGLILTDFYKENYPKYIKFVTGDNDDT